MQSTIVSSRNCDIILIFRFAAHSVCEYHRVGMAYVNANPHSFDTKGTPMSIETNTNATVAKHIMEPSLK